VRRLPGALRRGWFFTFAAAYGELAAATNAGIIGTEWQEKLPVEQVERVLGEHRDQISAGWTEHLDRLKRVLAVEGALEYEEVLQVLTLRSLLEFTESFVERKHSSDVYALDEHLADLLSSNRSERESCVQKAGHGFWGQIPSHWWCTIEQEFSPAARDPSTVAEKQADRSL
jgi:hypothetical protein